MNLIIRNFRQWWQIPRNIRDRSDHRQVTFLELFYDLVYVVLIAELTHALASHVDTEHLLQFGFMFVIVWWSWINGTLYHDIHGNDDIRTRVFTFMQMFSVAAMAVFAHDAFGDTSIGFALSYAGFQLILTYLWWRTGVHDKNHRPLSRSYTLMFLSNTTLFALSAFVQPPLRFYLWGTATLIAILFPLYMWTLGRNRPEVQEQIDLSRTATASLVERFGLFTIIVLGEVIVGVVQGIAGHHDLTAEVGIIGGMGMLIAFGLWWLYFDFISHRHPKPRNSWSAIWMYAHLPVTVGIATTGAAILNVVEHAGEELPMDVRWLFVGAISICLISTALLIQTLHEMEVDTHVHRIGQYAMILASTAIMALGLSELQTIPLLLTLILLMLAPIFFGFLTWIQTLKPPEHEDFSHGTIPN